jgi:hypothetical protein
MAPVEEDPGFCQTCGAQIFPESSFCHQCGMKVELKTKEETPPVKKEIKGFKDFKDFQLVQLYSVVNDYRYKDICYDNLKINWFVADRSEPPVPFEQSIVDYEELSLTNRFGPENFIKQRFTLEEAKLLKQYLFTTLNLLAFIEGCPLPVSNNSCGYRDLPPPPGVDFFILHQKRTYPLPFKVEGIFDTRMADEHVIGDDDRITVVSGLNVNDLKKYLKEKEEQDNSDSSS